MFSESRKENCESINKAKPNSIWKWINEKKHKILNHPGITTSYNAINAFIKIYNFKRKLEIQRNNCISCQKFLRTSHKYGYASGNLSTYVSFKHVSSDILGPMETNYFEEGE